VGCRHRFERTTSKRHQSRCATTYRKKAVGLKRRPQRLSQHSTKAGIAKSTWALMIVDSCTSTIQYQYRVKSVVQALWPKKSQLCQNATSQSPLSPDMPHELKQARTRSCTLKLHTWDAVPATRPVHAPKLHIWANRAAETNYDGWRCGSNNTRASRMASHPNYIRRTLDDIGSQ
jgi:hypothetical protein